MEILPNKDFEEFFECLNKNQVEYLIVGGYAVMYHSEPIATKDLDIWINPTKENARKVHSSIQDFFGVVIKDLTFEDLTSPDLIYQIGISPNRIDIITSITGVNFCKVWPKRVKTTYGKQPVWVIDKTTLIKNKRFLNREQDRWHLKKISPGKKTKDSPC